MEKNDIRQMNDILVLCCPGARWISFVLCPSPCDEKYNDNCVLIPAVRLSKAHKIKKDQIYLLAYHVYFK